MVLQEERISANPVTATAVVTEKKLIDGGSEGPTYLEVSDSFEAFGVGLQGVVFFGYLGPRRWLRTRRGEPDPAFDR